MSEYEPDEALVEVAARALYVADIAVNGLRPDWENVPEAHRKPWRFIARVVLRKVGPTLLARGWDEGATAAFNDPASGTDDRFWDTNPYRDGGAS